MKNIILNLRILSVFLLIGLGACASDHMPIESAPVSDPEEIVNPYPNCPTPAEPLKILVVDGGGNRGLIPTMLIAKLEEVFDRPATDIFDMFAGTSVGGLIAMALNAPAEKDSTEPAYRADELAELFIIDAKLMFKDALYDNQLRQLKLGMSKGTIYGWQDFESIAKKYLGNAVFGELLKPTMVVAFNDTKKTPIFVFTEEFSKLPLWQIAKATAAAPIYFPSTTLNISGLEKDNVVDGGVYGNSAAPEIYLEAKKRCPLNSIYLISFGTGLHKLSEITKQKVLDQMKLRAIDLVDSNVERSNVLVRQLVDFMNAKEDGTKDIFVRINPTIPFIELDSTKKDDLNSMLNAVAKAVKEAPFANVVELLSGDPLEFNTSDAFLKDLRVLVK